MAKLWRQALEKAERQSGERQRWEEEHPPITRISVAEADSQRVFTEIGQNRVSCNLPCVGKYIPGQYSHSSGLVNVFRKGVIVKGWESPQEGYPCYLGPVCDLRNKICATRDERLRKAVER